MLSKIKEIYDYREMIVSMIRRDLRGRYKASVLGFLWTFLNPLFQLFIYTMVFSIIMRANIEDFYIYLFIGLVPWNFLVHRLRGIFMCHSTRKFDKKNIFSSIGFTYYICYKCFC